MSAGQVAEKPLHAQTKYHLNCVEKARMYICKDNLFASPSSNLISLTVWSPCILLSLSLFHTLLEKLTAFLNSVSATLMCQKVAVKADEVADPKSQAAWGKHPISLQQYCSSPVPLVQDSRGPCRREVLCMASVPVHPCLQCSQVTEPAIAPSPPGCCWLFSASPRVQRQQLATDVDGNKLPKQRWRKIKDIVAFLCQWQLANCKENWGFEGHSNPWIVVIHWDMVIKWGAEGTLINWLAWASWQVSCRDEKQITAEGEKWARRCSWALRTKWERQVLKNKYTDGLNLSKLRGKALSQMLTALPEFSLGGQKGLSFSSEMSK